MQPLAGGPSICAMNLNAGKRRQVVRACECTSRCCIWFRGVPFKFFGVQEGIFGLQFLDKLHPNKIPIALECFVEPLQPQFFWIQLSVGTPTDPCTVLLSHESFWTIEHVQLAHVQWFGHSSSAS